jgi:hypothetical protein
METTFKLNYPAKKPEGSKYGKRPKVSNKLDKIKTN